MPDAPITVSVDPRGLATLMLNRAEKHNAFDDVLIAALTESLDRIGKDGGIRAMMLASVGKNFSAGADLNWMKRIAIAPEDENIRDARALAEMLRALNDLPIPTIALIQGAALGGGVGLVSCCDVAIASDAAVFSLSETKLGLIPATIGPYVAAAIGERQARRYFLTAERFSAAEARRIGLVHEVVPAAELEITARRMVETLMANGPRAMREAKSLIRAIAGRPIDAAVIDDTARRIARVRATDEAREGLAAFLEKRKPSWSG
ncbi:MAG: enoyl-CoA hydratase/isomerase family protein [Alphaproteobacteria bacterium]|nr:enoyl-CoA hydratase/isomerase family protein [Alphaproteobacteria bacterium]